MIHKFVCMIVIICMLAVPVSAAAIDEEGSTYGTVTDPTDSLADSEVSSDPVPAEEENSVSALSVADGDLAGGYYFVCDCALGDDLKFYVPVEWAHDVFTTDSSGELVNLSSSTCYAYCPDYPDYTFSCSRFNSFTYRASGSTTADLNISSVSDTNMSFFDSDSVLLSSEDILLLMAAFLFVLIGLTVIRRP